MQENSENNIDRNKSIWSKPWFIIIIVVIILIVIGGVGYAWYKGATVDLPNNIISATPKSSSPTTPSTPSKTTSSPTPTLTLENYNGGFFSIDKPVGWQVKTSGSCSAFSFVISDPQKPERKIFYFGELGPVYLNSNQRVLDQAYMDMGGYPVEWIDTVVVDPLNPDNFLKAMPTISQVAYINKFVSDIPQLNNLEIISSVSETSSIGLGEAKLIRALYKEADKVAEGQFYLATNVGLPYNGMPSAGLGFGFSITGISAEKKDYVSLEKILSQSIGSLNISQDYVNNCLAQQNQTYEGIMKAGKTLSETSDIIMSTWENKNRSDDIISEKRSDTMLGRDRVYSPSTGDVYEVDNGWYEDTYRPNSEKFDMNNLQKLPDSDWNLWTKSTQGANNIH